MHSFAYIRICLSLLTFAVMLSACPETNAEEVYGPVNLVKTMPTPFGPAAQLPGDEANAASLQASKPIAISRSTRQGRLSLSERLISSRLYLPGRMVLGKSAEFTIKGKPGSRVALAMADRDSGAKPIAGHSLRLGPDRKVVSVGVIDESGLLSLTIDTPIEGDLIGQHLFFEAACWTRPDYSDLVIATPVTSEGEEGVKNGVMISAEADQRRGLKIVPDSGIPLNQRGSGASMGINSGQP